MYFLSQDAIVRHYYYFGRQWIPGIGQEILLPKKENPLLEHIDIFTKTGQLLPTEFLETFKYDYYMNQS